MSIQFRRGFNQLGLVFGVSVVILLTLFGPYPYQETELEALDFLRSGLLGIFLGIVTWLFCFGIGWALDGFQEDS